MFILDFIWQAVVLMFGLSFTIYFVGRCWKSGWNIAKALVDALEMILTAVPKLISCGIRWMTGSND